MNYQINLPGAQGYTPQQTRGAFNQAMATAHAEGDPRYNMKPLDKAGASRGGGQQFMAGIASAQNLAKGVAAAYGVPTADAMQNASIELGNQAAREGVGLGAGGIAQQNQYANALASLQRQQAAQSFQQNLLGGLLGGGGGGWLDNFLGY
jgi:hypothetical protein